MSNFESRSQAEVSSEIRGRISRTVGAATVKNFGLTVLSAAGAALGGGNSSRVEGIHDAGDTATHGIDYLGTRSASQRAKTAARYLAGLGIVGSAAYFTYRSGVDMVSGSSELPGIPATSIQGVVAAGNHRIHTDMHHDIHEIEDLIAQAEAEGLDVEALKQDKNLNGSHRHAIVDAAVSPGMFASMVVAELTGVPEIADGGAMVGSGITAVANLEPMLPKRLQPTLSN